MGVHKLTERLLPGEVDQDLIDALKGLVERAERGEIVAIAWAGVTGNNHIINGWDGAGGTLFPLGASVMALQSRYSSWLMEDE